jgi:hypothetical protein
MRGGDLVHKMRLIYLVLTASLMALSAAGVLPNVLEGLSMSDGDPK